MDGCVAQPCAHLAWTSRSAMKWTNITVRNYKQRLRAESAWLGSHKKPVHLRSRVLTGTGRKRIQAGGSEERKARPTLRAASSGWPWPGVGTRFSGALTDAFLGHLKQKSHATARFML